MWKLKHLTNPRGKGKTLKKSSVRENILMVEKTELYMAQALTSESAVSDTSRLRQLRTRSELKIKVQLT
jgi:hypothetical protein